jgi:protein-L-isoaspartate(D-aspartate) O-methyltransferase
MADNPETARQMREEHVRRYIQGRGIAHPAVLNAMRQVPREAFVPGRSLCDVYGDHPLPIDAHQTISQPYMVAWMTAQLEPVQTDRALEIGTGSGYQTAILATLVDAVYSIEYHPALSEKAAVLLERLGYTNVHFKQGDGSLGWMEYAPYDVICVTAGAPCVPETLKSQLADGGRLVIPVGNRLFQELVRIVRHGSRYTEEKLGGCRFVPLRGEHGWK